MPPPPPRTAKRLAALPPVSPSRPGLMLSAATGVGMLLLSVTAASSFTHGWTVHAAEISATLVLLTGVFVANARGHFLFANVYMNILVALHLTCESLLFGPSVRSHDYFVVLALSALMFFPRRANVPMALTLLTIGLLWATTLVLFDVIAPLYVPAPEALEEFRFTNVVGLQLLLVVAGFFFRRHYTAAEAALEEERERADRLLNDILPRPIAEQLKRAPTSIAQAHHDVTIVFADIVDFTRMSAKMSPTDVVDMLNRVFTAFDGIAKKHGLEKIKTIGDAYMAASGVPVARPDHAAAAARMALDMLEVARTIPTPDGRPLHLRIGINSGPVVAGVIGTTKFIYYLWGDAVNTASRMESLGAPGAIQVTTSTRDALGDAFVVEERGVVEVKGKGPMTTWMLRGQRGTTPLRSA
jgi:class 3 adenylate cyclase